MANQDLEDIEDRISEIFITIGVAGQFLAKGVQLLQSATEDIRDIKRDLSPTIPQAAANGERARQD